MPAAGNTNVKKMRRGFKRITLLACLALLFPASVWAGGEGEGFNFEDKLNHHLMDSVIFEWNPGGEKIRPGHPQYENPAFIRRYQFRDDQGLYKYAGGLPMHITRRVAMMIVASLILCTVLIIAARKIAGNPHRINGRLANGVESIVQWVRHDIAHEGMHDHSKGFEPYILTLFFFLLTLNMFGLFPPIGEAIVGIYGALSGHAHGHHEPGSLESPLLAVWPGITVTGDVAVTFSMAFIAMLMMWITGFRYQGAKFLWHVVPNGVPWPLYLIMWPLEFIVGPVARAFALTIRLLANMTAGHVLLLALMGFIFMARDLWFGGPVGVVGGAGITLISVAGAVAIYMLEILVAFLQAFIFSVLTSLFIGGMMHRH
jgi:F-type H+-transporting ATPase subunit a